MGDVTGIEWADRTWQPWEGCEKVSPGCKNCYACERDKRWHDGKHWGRDAERKPMSDSYWRKPLRWNKEAQLAGRPLRVFCASLADVLEILPADHPSARMQFEARLRLWETIWNTPNLIWMLLTKRVENAPRLLPWCAGGATLEDAVWDEPWRNVWIGASIENQEMVDKRVPEICSVPAYCRFLSYEPALERIELPDVGGEIEWLIAGAESGPRARPAEEDWFRAVRDQCAVREISFFYKQKLDKGRKVSLPLLDGSRHAAFPTPIDAL